MTFFAQFNFTQSGSIVAKRPGDVMLFFAGEDWFDQDFTCEWYPSGIACLTSRAEIPQSPVEFVECYGARHRTFDLPNAADIFSSFPGRHAIAVLEAMKIGDCRRGFKGR